MIHNISSEGIRLMKEYAAEWYGVNPRQIVVRHKIAIGEAEWLDTVKVGKLCYLLSSSFSGHPPKIEFYLTDKYMGDWQRGFYDYKPDDHEVPEYPYDLDLKGFYFDAYEFSGTAKFQLSYLQFNIM